MTKSNSGIAIMDKKILQKAVILSAFFNDPNVENAIVRGKKEIELSDNKLKQLLEEFEKVANENRLNKLDKYDVFTSWLDYVFEEYLQEKESNE